MRDASFTMSPNTYQKFTKFFRKHDKKEHPNIRVMPFLESACALELRWDWPLWVFFKQQWDPTRHQEKQIMSWLSNQSLKKWRMVSVELHSDLGDDFGESQHNPFDLCIGENTRWPDSGHGKYWIHIDIPEEGTIPSHFPRSWNAECFTDNGQEKILR